MKTTSSVLFRKTAAALLGGAGLGLLGGAGPVAAGTPAPAAPVKPPATLAAPAAPSMLDQASKWMGESSNVMGHQVNNGLLTAGGVGAAGLLAYLLSRDGSEKRRSPAYA